MLGPHTFTRLRGAPTTDGYGDDEIDWSDPTKITRLPIEGCSVQPLVNAENTDGREALEERYEVWAPGRPDVGGRDRGEWDGLVYEVIGKPQVWDDPDLPHIRFTIKRSTG